MFFFIITSLLNINEINKNRENQSIIIKLCSAIFILIVNIFENKFLKKFKIILDNKYKNNLQFIRL